MGAAAGAAVGGVISAFGQFQTNKQNRREAQRNRDFQARMSGTAVYRRMQDMERAGINRILAGKYDASSPAGNMAVMQNPGAAAVSGAATSAKAVSETKMRSQHTRNLRLDADLKEPKAAIARGLMRTGQGVADAAKSTAKTFALERLEMGQGEAVPASAREQKLQGEISQNRTHNEAGLKAVAEYYKKHPKASRSALDAVYNAAVTKSQRGKN